MILISLNLQAKTLRVLEIDTGISLSHQEITDHIDFSNFNRADYIDDHPISHGTHIAGLIVKDTCKQVELISCKYFFQNTSQDVIRNEINCFKRALTLNIDVINYSSYGYSYVKEEYELLKQLRDKNIIIITSAGNEGNDISLKRNRRYLSGYDLSNIIVVGNL